MGAEAMTKITVAKDAIKASLGCWLKPLGLLWWYIEVVYYDDPAEVLQRFGNDSGKIVAARTYAEWQYATAKIEFNLLAICEMNSDEIEHIVVHELFHILVNEMREGEMHHEERVVTTLTKAAFWLVGR